jgi:hypothetical protein
VVTGDVHGNAAGIKARLRRTSLWVRLRTSLCGWEKRALAYKWANPLLALLTLLSFPTLLVYVVLETFPTLGKSPFELNLAILALFLFVISAGFHGLLQVQKRATFYGTLVALGNQLLILLDRAESPADYREIEERLTELQIKSKQEIPAGASLTQVLSDMQSLVPWGLPSDKAR